MRILFIVNASASSVTARARVVIQKALGADHAVGLAATSRRGHATRLAQGAAADGVDVVVVLGGDGTVNEAANGLVGTATALAVLPGGSTNVFARTLGMT
ncbi:MAG: diacylglycerol kinase family protein, partial [Acidimicrobiales bacterium]